MILKIDILEKKFGNQIILKNINTQFNSNRIYGIIGKNGEGKTTFFKCILSLLKYKGTIFFNDKVLEINQVAWCPTQPLIYDELTPLEFKKFYSELFKMKESDNKDLFKIPQNKLIKEFSTGMKKKAYLNAIFQKKFQIYILDEPFNGLDIESNYQLMNYLKERSKESIVIISSHILDTLYAHCDNIYLIQNSSLKQFEKKDFGSIEQQLFV